MGMGFEVVHSPVQPIWCPVDTTDVLAVGMMVYYGKATPANTGGVKVMPAAVGVSDYTNYLVPFGVIIGTNNAVPVYSTLSTANVKVETITGVDTAAAQLARDWRLAEGMFAKGDPQPLVRVARIVPGTIIKGFFRNSATVGTTSILTNVCKASLSTTSIPITATAGFTAVAENATAYCVKGANAGLYRVRTDTDTGATAMTFTRAWPYTPIAGDTFKTVNVRQGMCRMNFDTTYGLWIDNTAALTSHYYTVIVHNIDLSVESGEENCLFEFSYNSFLNQNTGRAVTT